MPEPIPRSRRAPRRIALAVAGVALAAVAVFEARGLLLAAPAAPPPPGGSGGEARTEAAAVEQVVLARRRGVEGLTAWIERQRARIASARDDAQKAEALEHLAFALSERCSARNDGRGIRVAEPLYDEVPPATESDVQEGLAALEAARALGRETSESYRIEALLLSCRVIGLMSAMKWDGKIRAATQKAFELDPDNPRAQIAQAVREVLLPSYMGQDPEKALERLLPAAEALPLDERPLVFGAFAAHLLGRGEQCLELLGRAIERRPDANYARAVRDRILAERSDPFGEDVVEPGADAVTDRTGSKDPDSPTGSRRPPTGR
jgi:tetratricopeptide (TPR) repeat protein